MDHVIHIPETYIQFFLVVLYSLVIGLSQRKLRMKKEARESFFGSDRTFTLIGIFSYILYIVDPVSKVFWGVGGLALVLLLSISYFFKAQSLKRFGITSILTALITYCTPALIITQPLEFSLLVLVVVLLLTEMKETFTSFAQRMKNDEFITFAKFIIIAGIILPILSTDRIVDFIDLSPRTIWLTTVIISGMSYISYLLQKFVFKDSGLLVAGIFGGLYSSTATTVVLARKSVKAPDYLQNRYSGAIVLATGMMFLRLAILLFIFNLSLFGQMWYYFAILFVLSMGIGIGIYYFQSPTQEQLKSFSPAMEDKNPLEFKVSLIFALLFVIFTVATHFTIQEFGAQGLMLLSVLAGITDITPFVIGLFQGGYDISAATIVSATFLVLVSSNILKMVYGLMVGSKGIRRMLVIGFSAICLATLVALLIVM